MAEGQDLAKQPTGPLATLKRYVNDPDTQARLSQMLGANAGTFANSILNVVSGNAKLRQCDPKSVMRSAMIAASVKLPIDPALGFAAIVPYKTSAQFQLMYKGVIQLCIRSGQYERIYDTEVYRDELDSYNPITGDVRFKNLTEYKLRPNHRIEDVVGFYCHFKLLKGFRGSLYMTKEEVLAHAERFSRAYQYDLRSKKKDSPWSTDPIAMGRKTVILQLLKRYGIMSVEMQDAIIADTNEDDGGPKHVDSTTLDATEGRQPFGFDPPDEKPEQEPAGEAGQQQQQQQPAEENTSSSRKCWQCKKAPGTPLSRVTCSDGNNHLVCDSCREKLWQAKTRTSAPQAEQSAGTGQTGEPTDEPATEPETAPAPPFAPDQQVTCDKGHTFEYKRHILQDGIPCCPQCGNFIKGPAEEAQETPNELPGTLTCPKGHVVNRADIIPSILASKPGMLGKCPVCDKQEISTIIKEPKPLESTSQVAGETPVPLSC